MPFPRANPDRAMTPAERRQRYEARGERFAVVIQDEEALAVLNAAREQGKTITETVTEGLKTLGSGRKRSGP